LSGLLFDVGGLLLVVLFLLFLSLLLITLKTIVGFVIWIRVLTMGASFVTVLLVTLTLLLPI
jgi:hypothetical protein